MFILQSKRYISIIDVYGACFQFNSGMPTRISGVKRNMETCRSKGQLSSFFRKQQRVVRERWAPIALYTRKFDRW